MSMKMALMTLLQAFILRYRMDNITILLFPFARLTPSWRTCITRLKGVAW